MAKKTNENENVYIPDAGSAAPKGGAASGGDTVTVALCYPQGIQFLLDGGKRRVHLNGNAANLAGLPKGVLPRGGFGLTVIPRADWEAIKAAYGARLPIFKNGLCFAHDSRADTIAEADEKAELRHGREPVAIDAAKTEPVDAAAVSAA